jgi:uracil-DNA glycosylase
LFFIAKPVDLRMIRFYACVSVDTMQGDLQEIAQTFADFSVLEWYLEAGVNEVQADVPINRMAMPSVASLMGTDVAVAGADKPVAVASLSSSPSMAAAEARSLAQQAQAIEDLYDALQKFDGCALKRTAMHTVVGEGCLQPELLIISDTPRDAEDRDGRVFAGDAERILHHLCLGAGVMREQCYVLPSVFWRPPGNRAVSAEELAVCQPFVEKSIALIAPKRIIVMGATPVKMLLKLDGALSRLRGSVHAYTNTYCQDHSYPVMVTYHPYAVMGDGVKKKQLWQDFLASNFLVEER